MRCSASPEVSFCTSGLQPEGPVPGASLPDDDSFLYKAGQKSLDLRHAGSGKGGELAGPGGDVLCQIVDNEGFPDSGGCFRSLCCSRRGFLRLPGRLERQSQDSPFRREFLGDGRDRQPLFLPHTENIRQAASSALPHVDEVEHAAEGGVPGIGNSAAAGVLNGDAKGARIGKSDFFHCFSDGNADGAAVISVDKAVGQGLPQGVLDRGWFGRRGKSAADAEIEIVQAAAPVAGGGDNAFCPVEFSGVLFRNRQILVVQEIAGKFPDDFIFFQFEVRMIISVPAARLAAIRRTDEDLRKLEDCLESFINCPYSTAEEQIQSAKWDSLLHHMVMEAAHNPMLSRINESIDTLVEKNNLLLHPSLSHEEGWVQHIQQQHAQIISAIKTHDAETAGSILRQHMVESIQAISEKRPDLVSQKRLLQLGLLY